MTRPYNGRPAVGQSADAARRRSAALRSAEHTLFASCAVTDQAAAMRVEALLRARAALLGDRADATGAGECLSELASDCACDAAAVALIDARLQSVSIAVETGRIATALASLVHHPAFASPLRAAWSAAAAIEHPVAEERSGLPAPAIAEIYAVGFQSVRWALRAREDGGAVLVALHARTRCRYWTPAARRLHDGMADLLAAIV
jgi:hypothetical protein